MKHPMETLADGLWHPEGPDVLPDGRIVMVETYTSRLFAWDATRGIHLYADCGGGPNACMLGSDGAAYITQNGGTGGRWRSFFHQCIAIRPYPAATARSSATVIPIHR